MFLVKSKVNPNLSLDKVPKSTSNRPHGRYPNSGENSVCYKIVTYQAETPGHLDDRIRSAV